MGKISTIKKRHISWEFSGQISLENDPLCPDLTNVFKEKRRQFCPFFFFALRYSFDHEVLFNRDYYLLFEQQCAREIRQWQSFLHRGHCPVFRIINLRTSGSFGLLVTRCSDEASRKICEFTASEQLQQPR